MTLHPIVAALGGDLYDRGQRANVPAPGHSPQDRSVSLRLVDGRVLVHAFGATDWRAVLSDLRARGLVDADSRLAGVAGRSSPPAWPDPSGFERINAARRLWAEAIALPGTLSERHLRLRSIERAAPADLALRHHSAAPVSAYAAGSPTCPALLAGIVSPAGELVAVEITYLDPNGRRTRRLRLARKTVGRLATGSAVRLDPAAPAMLVGEGVFTVLSASERFKRPGWALLSTGNLRAWKPPQEARSVWIAADRGPDGERSAAYLAEQLRRSGLDARVLLPPARFGDWNDLARDCG